MNKIRNKGEVAYEYIVLLLLVIVAIIIGFTLLGKGMKTNVNAASNSIASAQVCAIKGLSFDPAAQKCIDSDGNVVDINSNPNPNPNSSNKADPNKYYRLKSATNTNRVYSGETINEQIEYDGTNIDNYIEEAGPIYSYVYVPYPTYENYPSFTEYYKQAEMDLVKYDRFGTIGQFFTSKGTYVVGNHSDQVNGDVTEINTISGVLVYGTPTTVARAKDDGFYYQKSRSSDNLVIGSQLNNNIDAGYVSLSDYEIYTGPVYSYDQDCYVVSESCPTGYTTAYTKHTRVAQGYCEFKMNGTYDGGRYSFILFGDNAVGVKPGDDFTAAQASRPFDIRIKEVNSNEDITSRRVQ